MTSLEYEGPRERVQTARNLPLKCGSKQVLWNKIVKKVSLKRFAGPFKEVPFKYYVQSPVGFDKVCIVRMMTNTDNVESSLLTSNLLNM